MGATIMNFDLESITWDDEGRKKIIVTINEF